MKKALFGLLAATALVGCGTSTDGTKLRATAEQEAARDVENRNLRQKADQLETYLGVQHKLYGALEGEFEGTVMVNGEAAKIRLVISRSIQEYRNTRTRQLSEIENDINSLRLNVVARQWSPRSRGSAVGCNYSLVRPNFNQGSIELQPANANTECRLTYRILVNIGGIPERELRSMDQASAKWESLREMAQNEGARLNSGDYRPVEELVGTVQSTFGESAFVFDIKRVH